MSVAPNPFSNSTTISFSVAPGARISIQVYDITGRLVKVLADGQMQAGTYQLTWDAKDERGTSVAAGIYFLKIRSGSHTETKKMVVERSL